MIIGYVLLILSATPTPVSDGIYSLDECAEFYRYQKSLLLNKHRITK